MANILYMAISRDGFIAGEGDETPWSDAEYEAFESFVKSCDMILLGRRTFELTRANDEFIKGPEYIVVTDNEDLDTGKFKKIAIHTLKDIPKVSRLGIVGGGELNGRLVQLGAIDEIILDIEPIELQEGIKLLGSYDVPLTLELIGSKQIGDATLQRRYRVLHL